MNIWKWLFFILLLFNIIVAASLIFMLSSSYGTPEEEDNYSGGSSGIEIKMTNDAVESLIMDTIEDESLSLEISESGIELLSRNNIYGISVDASFILEPVSTGDTIVFEVSDIDIANIPLSQNALYSIIRSQSDLPEGISFSEDERALVIDTALFDGAAGLDMKVDSIDYENNEWYFSMER
ncbi:DUF2140 family protein [Salinicoccus halodurans]|uniref:Uncharacterized protein YpmS n=1 Tax=Salinicoccus halodurans TaxID=407035 RepID=A0A0F7HME9_9STAP|nr:DUF2140 family protein [Salinicoccus halodurans]AKG74113.1 hypothetical protein AAT16_07630 [Salinicoccus halodurans]SFK60652.1 Uncharacterized protein YpmS [Salinicoccus halodurans]